MSTSSLFEFSYSPESLSYDEIALLDPLELDGVLSKLPEINSRQDVSLLVNATRESLIKSELINNPNEAIASLRDLDFLISSLIKHGSNPLDIEGLEAELARLGNITGSVPRGTVFTYAATNPDGERMRTFTGSTEEFAFIGAVREGIFTLDEALYTVSQAPVNSDSEFAEALYKTSVAMGIMKDSIVTVHRTVSPEFFTHQMRPYFEPLEIEGKSYTGSGGAQMQLLAVDRILWGVDDTDKTYQSYFEENQQYLTPNQKRALETFTESNGPFSVLTRIQADPERTIETKEAAISTLKAVKKFRYPHRTVAVNNFKVRPHGAVGSGQYSTGILDNLIAKTEAAIAELEGRYGQED